MKQEKLLATKEAIHRRRSIRKFKPDPVPDECITALLESARLAPSGCNDHIFVVALLPVGYPEELPAPRKRLSLEALLID